MEEEKKSGRGGFREGAGRKRADIKRECHTVTFLPDEWERIKALADEEGKTVSRLLIDTVLQSRARKASLC